MNRLFISTIILLLLDIIYLNFMTGDFKEMVKNIQGLPIAPRTAGAIVSYILIIWALNKFILDENKTPMDAAILGLVIYGVFDSVNYAIFRNYSIKVGVMDTLWGAILLATTTYLTYSYFPGR